MSSAPACSKICFARLVWSELSECTASKRRPSRRRPSYRLASYSGMPMPTRVPISPPQRVPSRGWPMLLSRLANRGCHRPRRRCQRPLRPLRALSCALVYANSRVVFVSGSRTEMSLLEKPVALRFSMIWHAWFSSRARQKTDLFAIGFLFGCSFHQKVPTTHRARHGVFSRCVRFGPKFKRDLPQLPTGNFKSIIKVSD